MIRLSCLLITFVFAVTTSYAGTSNIYTNSSTLEFGPEAGTNIVDVTLNNVTDTNGGTLTLWAFDIDNPGSGRKTEEVTVQISYNGGSTFSSFLEWDYYQVSNEFYRFAAGFDNYTDKGTISTYASKIYTASSTASDSDSNDGDGVDCQGSKACLIGEDGKYARIVFTIPDFTIGKGFTSGDDLIVRIKMQNSDYLQSIVDHLTFEVFTNTLPTSSDFTVSKVPTNYTFSLSDFSFSDADSGTDGDQLEAIKINSSPASGELEYYDGSSWVDAIQNQEITRAELSANKLRASADFTFKVSDGYAFSSSSYTVTVAADSAPTISSVSFNAANDALTVTFSEDVYNTNGGSGDLEASDFALSISNGTATLTATPSSITKTSQSVWVLGVSTSGTADGNEMLSVVPSGAAAIYDATGNAASTTQSNNTASLTEEAAPILSSSSPADNATDVSVSDNLQLTFSEAVDLETGFITVKRVADDSVFESFNVATSPALSGSGTNTITIDPSSNMDVTVSYYLEVDATAIDDAAGNSYAGLSGAAALNFTTAGPVDTPITEFESKKSIVKSQLIQLTKQKMHIKHNSTEKLILEARKRFEVSRETANYQQTANIEQNIQFSIPNLSITTRGAEAKARLYGELEDTQESSKFISSNDFSINRDYNGTSTFEVINRLVWEKNLSKETTAGFFLGTELTQSNIYGQFSGKEKAGSVLFGGYILKQLNERLYFNAYASAHQTEHEVSLNDNTLFLDGDYTSQSVLGGATLNGKVKINDSMEAYPTVKIRAGSTKIGTIAFTGTAFGATASGLELMGESLFYGTLSLSQKISNSNDGRKLSKSELVSTINPRIFCDYQNSDNVTSRNCGSGIGFEVTNKSFNFWDTFQISYDFDLIGSAQTRQSISLKATVSF